MHIYLLAMLFNDANSLYLDRERFVFKRFMLSPHTSIRYDIVFLRCLAVLAVLCFHFKLPLFREGYAGVDVFFVLSGFLMTQIITENMQTGTFNLWHFYFRRLARILPALLVVLLFFLFLIYAVLGIKLYDYSRFALSSSIFVSNIYYYQASGYFAPSSQLNFLLHTWSLSVEWQFYLLYPLLWLGFNRLQKYGQKISLILLYLITILSFLNMLYCIERDQSFAFYMFPTRAWELIVGGLAYFHTRDLKYCLTQQARKVLGILLLSILLSSLCGLVRVGSSGWPSVWTLIPVCCTAGVLVVAPKFCFFKTFVPVFVARISYTWYLWHWPIVVLSAYFALDQRIEQRLLFFCVSFFVSVAAYFLVERGRFFRRPALLIGGLVFVVFLTFSLTQIPLTRLLPQDSQTLLVNFQRLYTLRKAPEQYNFTKGHLLANAAFDTFDKEQLLQFSDSTQNYLLLGDCHAGMFSATLRKLATKNAVHLLQATGDETFPALGVKSAFEGPTALMNYMYSTYLPANMDKIDKVIIAANYAGYSKKQLIAYFSQLTQFFERYQVPVVYIGQTESYRVEYPVIEVLENRFAADRQDYLDATRYYANQFLKHSSIADKYIDIYDLPFIKHADAGSTYFYDADHLSVFGTEQYAELLENKIFLSGK